MNEIPIEDWRWYGGAGHFICAQWCRFHMATEIGEFLISTVGEYVHPRHAMGSEQKDTEWWNANWPGEDIGCGRKYETLVFRTSGERCNTGPCNCQMPQIVPTEIDSGCYNDPKSAREGHMALCRKWANPAIAEAGTE